MRIAMWSGPRNLSTAMMYSFAQRSDCAVVDEPFYAAYLVASGNDHPMRDEVIAAGESDPQKVADMCAGPIPGGRPVHYQKHMTHHMLDGFPMDWIDAVTSVFLIRHPARVVASYSAKWEGPTFEELGFAMQEALFERAASAGVVPPVVDSDDIRKDPERVLTRLCTRLGIGFDPAMLSWQAGGRPEDGVWAAHWYGAVHRSTGFAGPEGDLPRLEGAHRDLVERALPIYERLARHRL